MTDKPKHIFFDLDDTLTPSRSRMSDALVPLFGHLCDSADVVVVSGAQASQIQRQLPGGFRYFVLSQNGNHATLPDGTTLWSESFSDEQKALIMAFITKLRTELALPVSDEQDLVEDRGSQISYSLIGHNEALDKKRAFDPRGEKRKAILQRFAEDRARLLQSGIEVTVGGTTCLDIFLAGRHKGYHVARLIEHMGWSKEACLYVGDALEPGRNDETVIGVIPTKSVTGPDDTSIFIKEMVS